ncbi:MAG: rRNA maturation RNase YbeY [Gammaproteobacteria bacterium]|nr:rRNA maturation RNase YbeY [Gammaproteobacteria bacterium]
MLLDLQIAEEIDDSESIPSQSDFERWAEVALKGVDGDSELTIRIVSEEEISELNLTYRDKCGSTNVLSFPFEMPDFGIDEEPGESQLDEFERMEMPLLGDLVICAAVVNREAAEQNKPPQAHWAHMTIHGILHLLGHDHIETADAEAMESLEITLLSQLDYPTPY